VERAELNFLAGYVENLKTNQSEGDSDFKEDESEDDEDFPRSDSDSSRDIDEGDVDLDDMSSGEEARRREPRITRSKLVPGKGSSSGGAGAQCSSGPPPDVKYESLIGDSEPLIKNEETDSEDGDESQPKKMKLEP